MQIIDFQHILLLKLINIGARSLSIQQKMETFGGYRQMVTIMYHLNDNQSYEENGFQLCARNIGNRCYLDPKRMPRISLLRVLGQRKVNRTNDI